MLRDNIVSAVADRDRALSTRLAALRRLDDADVLAHAAIVVALLNEPLPVLPRIAAQRLAPLDVVVAADTSRQRVVLCPHPWSAAIADVGGGPAPVSSRRRCPDCDTVVAPARAPWALHPELGDGCAFFRDPRTPETLPFVEIDGRRVVGERIVVGGAPRDDVPNAGLPAGALSLERVDDGFVARTVAGVSFAVRSPLWRAPAADPPIDDERCDPPRTRAHLPRLAPRVAGRRHRPRPRRPPRRRRSRRARPGRGVGGAARARRRPRR